MAAGETPDLTKSKPTRVGLRKGEDKNQKRPLTDSQRRAKRRKQDKPVVAFASENEQYSISGQKARTGAPEYRNNKNKLKAQIEQLKQDIPAPLIANLEVSNPVLAQIADDALRTRVQKFLQTLLEGGKHKHALADNDFTWQMVQNLKHKYTGLHELWVICRDIGDEYRQVLRADAAHERAVEGVEEPVYSNTGKFLGSRRVYSDRLLELLLKADNPEKYAAKTDVNVQGTVINLTTGFDRAALREGERAASGEVVDAEYAEGERV